MKKSLVLALVALAACGGPATTGTTAATTSATTSATTTGTAAGGSSSGTSSASSSSSSSTTTTTTASSTSSGTTTTGTSGAATTGSSSGTTGSTSGSSCPGYASPTEAASCPCASGHTCSANGCYGGWYCDLATNRCVAPPSQCSGGSTTTTTTTTGGSTTTTGGSTTGSTSGGHTGAFRVLFDAAHKQVEGNACWIVDSNMPDPQPSSPGSETDWSGGISAWGFDLWQSGRYSIAQLPTGTSLNYGQGGAGDLSQFDVFISDEPEQPFSSSEQAALMQFANAGKGIFLISDHSGAVRCSSCTEATQVINGFLVSGAGTSFGASCDNNDVGSNGLLGSVTGQGPASIGSGPFGSGSQLSYHSGSTVSASGNAKVVINSSAGGMMVSSELSSGGRLVLVGDSSPEEDGTTSSCSATLHNGWGEANDRELILNATAWLAHDGS